MRLMGLSMLAAALLVGCLSEAPAEYRWGATADDDGGDTATDEDAAAEVDKQPPPPSPCLSAAPELLDFGAHFVPVAQERAVGLRACEDRVVMIKSLSLVEDYEGAYEISQPLPLPLQLAPGQRADLQVLFRTAAPSRLTASGQPIPTVAAVEVETDTWPEPLRIPLRGVATRVVYPPPPSIVCEEGVHVLLGTTLHLQGSHNDFGVAPMAAWGWAVQAPYGSQATFSPSGTVADPTFTPDLPGTYVFKLWARDTLGNAPATDGTLSVLVE